MTDEELKENFKRIHNAQLVYYILLIVLLGTMILLQIYETQRLICSSDNPPKACKE